MLKVIITYKCVWEIERDIERVTEKDIARDRDRHRHRERERERERERDWKTERHRKKDVRRRSKVELVTKSVWVLMI